MSFTNFEQGDDWELGDAIRIPVDLDDDPETDEQAGDGATMLTTVKAVAATPPARPAEPAGGIAD